MIQVLIVDDHAMVRKTMSRLLSEISDFEVIATTGSGEEAVKSAKQKRPDVVLMDIRMPGMGGIVAFQRILKFDPTIKVILVTAFDEDPFPTKLLRAGASGFLKKGTSINEMVTAIRCVYAGQRYLNPEIMQQQEEETEVDLSLSEADTYSHNPFARLSICELRMMLMITHAQTPKSIAQELRIRFEMIDTYRQQLYEKLRVHNDVQLTLLARKYGFLEILTREQLSERQKQKGIVNRLVSKMTLSNLKAMFSMFSRALR